jgi:TonB-dependent receptor
MKSLYKLLLCFTFLFVSLVQTIAQSSKGIIVGKINDAAAKNNDPLPYANIGIPALNLGANTDLDGNFRIVNVPAGKHKLVISYVGYDNFETEIDISAGQTVTFDHKMQPSGGVNLETVIISAQAVGQRAAINEQVNSNTIVNVISKEKLQELPDQNAAESLGRLSGVALQRDGGEGTKVSVRGLSPRFVSVTVNGERIPSTDANDRSVDLAMISPEMLGGIEVFKALRPDMEGDAIGGSVNFAVKKADETPKGDLKILNTGNFQENQYLLPRLSASYSRRFLDKKIGMVATTNFQRANRGSDNFEIAPESIGSRADGTPIQRINSISLSDRLEQRDRYGASLTLDFSPNKLHSILLTSNFGRTDRDYTLRRRRFRYVDGRQQYEVRDGTSQTNLFSNTLSGDHTFGAWMVNWRGSFGQSEQETPEEVRANFVELAATKPVNINDSDPAQVISAFKNTLSETFLFDARQRTALTQERNLSAQIDLKRNLVLTDKINGFIKIGGKMRHQYRKNDNNELVARTYLVNDGKEGIGRLFPDYFVRSGQNILMANFLSDDYQVGSFLKGAYDANLGTEKQRAEQTQGLSGVDATKHNALFGTNYNGSSRIGYNGSVDPAKLWAFYRQFRGNYRRDGLIKFEDYEGTEGVVAAYAMTEMNIGKRLLVVGGVRYEQTKTDYSALSGPTSDVEDNDDLNSFNKLNANYKREYGEILPSLQARFKATNWFDIRAASYKSLSRPSYNLIIPVTRINPNDRSIVRGTPDLLHTTAWNNDLFLSFYNKFGLFTIGGFYKELQNVDYEFANRRLVDTSQFNGYRLTSSANVTQPTQIRGVEVDLQANLAPLSSWLKGFTFGANVTFMETKTYYPLFEFRVENLPEPPFVRSYTFDTVRLGQMREQPNFMANLSLGYDFKGFSSRLSYTYQGDKLALLGGQRPEQDVFTSPIARWDLALKQKINKRLTVMLNLNNISNAPERSNIPNFNAVSRVIEDEFFGMTGDIGLQFKF